MYTQKSVNLAAWSPMSAKSAICSMQKKPPRAAENSVVIQRVSTTTPASGQQQGLLFPVTEVEFDGVAMGVLSDGTPYLHLRGLARLCGVDSGMLSRLTSNWSEERTKPRGARINELLAEQNFFGNTLHVLTVGPSGEVPVYTDAVCMALLEYYAFDAKQGSPEVAQRNFRLLARKSFRQFIYDGCGYKPEAEKNALWQNFHDRVSLNFDSVPEGYFSVFKQIADLIVSLGQRGLHIHKKFVPDISVGQCWSAYWKTIDGSSIYGQRIHYKHNYPEYYPQAASNPQEPWCYPEMALGEFQKWFRENYVKGGRLKNYLHTKVKDSTLPVEFVNQAVSLLEAPR
ncbi:hypothetical protein [Acidovorax sp. CCYZU-2555]|uniref:hypothetical protein n=1 Tax=Acidovorax sp. CCYZU-2555 TaxID=2835042 RepID=UPI001BCEBF6F|nr:hypothetical protein [Acidovorax sp. CCYZU-2555]MBS7777670.1 hypothetical protein [Acidovorax sp. CCYZU-2555]